MDSTDLEVLRTAVAWHQAGLRFAIATVVRTWGSAPRPPGAWIALRADGVMVGSVSGGCIEDDLARRMLAGEWSGGPPQVLGYGLNADEAHRFGLPCGGTLRLVLEPAPRVAVLQELLQRLERREIVVRHLGLASGEAVLRSATPGDALSFDGHVLETVHGPRRRLLIIGAGQVSVYLAQMAQALDYHVIVCDPRGEHAAAWSVPGVELRSTMPDDTVLDLQLDAECAVVALTHDPKLDDMALLEALKSPAFYVGALGSRANSARRRERLALFDLAPEQVARLHGPVGLPIGSRTPPEIAVAILAHLVAEKNKVSPREAALPVREGCTA